MAQKEPSNSKPEESKPQDKATSKALESPMETMAQTKKAKPKDPKTGSTPPPNEMNGRLLDVVGQCAGCKPRDIEIDEWAGTFDGERREKQQLAIDPVLRELQSALEAAHSESKTLEAIPTLEKALEEDTTAHLGAGLAHLKEAQEAVERLRTKSVDTPYAMIGLQMVNVRQAHIDPAYEELELVRGVASERRPHVERAAFHIERALGMLADLTKTYEAIKREHKIEDAMQRLAKMHQIFLEDTQATMGSGKPRIHQFDRKIAEVDEALVEALKEMLEKEKAIIAELSKTLAEDPRMLRRYLASLQLQATTYVDQLTLLAQRQSQLRDQVQTWVSTPVESRSTWVTSLWTQYATQETDVLQDATKMYENMETWLPLDLQVDHPDIQPWIQQGQHLLESLTASVVSLPKEDHSATYLLAEQSLEYLRSLQKGLAALEVPGADAGTLGEFKANRLEELARLITTHSGWLKTAQSIDQVDFGTVAEVTQGNLARDTQTLIEKLDGVCTQVASMSAEIQETSETLMRVMKMDIQRPQVDVVAQLNRGDFNEALPWENHLVVAFGLAESQLVQLIQLIIEKSDAAPPPSGVSEPTSLETMLAMLESELKAKEKLGIPLRPINVSIQKDWMANGSCNSPGMGQSQAQAAMQKGKKAMKDAERAKAAARGAAKEREKAFAQANALAGGDNALGPESAKKSWNVLVSQLEKDLLQGRDTSPPEQYREAIQDYFRILAERDTGGRP